MPRKPASTARLTEAAIAAAVRQAAATGKRIDTTDPGQPGLVLRVTPSGTRSWVLAAPDGFGRNRRFPIGSHPAIGIAEARVQAQALRERVRKGADPIADARRKRALGRAARDGEGAVTLDGLLDLYGRAGRGSELKNWRAYASRIRTVFAAHRRAPLASLTAADLQASLDAWTSRSAAATCVGYWRPIAKWASAPARGYCDKSLGEVEAKAKRRIRQTVLSREQLAALLPVLRDPSSLPEGAQVYAGAFRMILLTASRRQMVGSMTWGEIDLGETVWTVAGARMKAERQHAVPLSDQALGLLRERLPAGDKTPPAGALVFPSSTAKALSGWQHGLAAVQFASKTSGWSIHDLRRTAATILGELGVEPFIVELCLAHSLGSLQRTYNLSRYVGQLREALQKLADELDRIERGGALVIPFRAA